MVLAEEVREHGALEDGNFRAPTILEPEVYIVPNPVVVFSLPNARVSQTQAPLLFGAKCQKSLFDERYRIQKPKIANEREISD